MNFINELQNSARRSSRRNKGLNTFLATFCVIDLFGVFPIVALPAAVISCGIYGFPLLLFVIIVQIYTAVILGRCWVIAETLDPRIVEKSRYPYAAVAELVYGKRMRLFVTTLLNITVFGAGIPNFLVASQNLQLIGERISDGEFSFSFCYWLIILGIVLSPIMWLGSPKNMKLLATVSVVTVILVSLLVWSSILMDDFKHAKPFDGLSFNSQSNLMNMLKVYGMIAFQFDVHPMLMTIEVDMEKRHNIGNVVFYGISATVFLSIVTTCLAAFRYGISVTPNVLEILPKSNTFYLAITLVTLQLCLSSAVGHSALFQQIEDYFGVSRDFNAQRCLLRTFIILLAILIAEIIPKFDLVMGMIGGTLTGPLIFILPPLLYRRIRKMERVSRAFEETDIDNELMLGHDDDAPLLMRAKNAYGTFLPRVNETVKFPQFSDCFCLESGVSALTIVFGLIATFASTYFNVLNASTLADLWSPCISNISFHLQKF